VNEPRSPPPSTCQAVSNVPSWDGQMHREAKPLRQRPKSALSYSSGHAVTDLAHSRLSCLRDALGVQEGIVKQPRVEFNWKAYAMI
jgi:hypothetical protein